MLGGMKLSIINTIYVFIPLMLGSKIIEYQQYIHWNNHLCLNEMIEYQQYMHWNHLCLDLIIVSPSILCLDVIVVISSLFRLASATTPIVNNNTGYVISILSEDMLKELEAMLHLAIINQDDNCHFRRGIF